MTHRTRRLLSLALATAMVTGGLPSAWARATAETTATVAQGVPEVEPWTVADRLDENSEVFGDRYLNAYPFEGLAGQVVTINLTSNNLNTWLILLDPNNQVVAEDVSYGERGDVRLVLTLPTTGVYAIGVTSTHLGGVGDYQLTLQPGTTADLEGAARLEEARRLNDQGIELYQAGRYTEAELLFLRVVEISREALGDRHPDIATSLNNLATLYQTQGRYGEAELLHQESLIIRREQLGDRHPDVANSLNNLADLYRIQGRSGEAEPLFLQALEIYRELDDRHPDVAASLNNLALLYATQGRYVEAELIYQESLEILREQLGNHNTLVATNLVGLAELYRLQGRYVEAELFYQDSLEIYREQLGDRHPDVATNLNNLALLYQAQGLYIEAEPLYQESLEIYRETLGDRHPNVAQSLNNLAGLYQAQGRYREAEPLFLQALEIIREQLGDRHPSVATSLNNLAALYQAQGRYGDAEPLYQQTLMVYREQLGDRHPSVATSLNNLAALYRAQGRYGDAEPRYLEALDIVREQLGDRHPDVATSLNNLAALYDAQGRYGEAEPLFLQSLEIRREQLGDRHPSVATSLNNLAALYRAQGRYEEAEPLYQESLAIYRDILGDRHPDVANSLNNLAGLYRAQGRYGEAEPLFLQSLEIIRKQLGDRHPSVATSLNSLAGLYRDQGRYGEAEPLYQESLAIYRETLGNRHPNVANSLNNLAGLYRIQGRYGEAELLHQESLIIRRELLGDRHPSVSTSLNNLAVLYQEQGRYEEVEPLYQESLEISREQLGDRHPDVATSLNNLAALYQAQDNIDTALTYLWQGLDVEETNLSLNLAIGSEDRKQAYMATIAGTTNYAFSLHFQDAPDNRDAAHLAFTTLLRRKGRILDALTDTQQRLRQNLSPDIALVLDDYASAQSQLAALLYRGLDEQDPADYRRQIDELRQTVNRLENDLSRRSAEFRVETEPVEIAAIQALLPANAALVEIVQYSPFDAAAGLSDRWGAPRYAAYVLHPTGDLQWVELGDAATIDAAAFDFLNAVRNPASGTTARTTGRALDALVMEPLRPLLGDATHLLLSPDSQLNLVPFAALVDEQDQFLVESYTLTHLTTGRDLLRLQVTASSQQPPVLFANPDYDTANPSSTQIVAATRSLSEAEESTLSRATTRSLSEAEGSTPTTRSLSEAEGRRSAGIAALRFVPLPGTQLEVDAIAPLLNNPVILTETDATEAALKQVQGPSILHIATHGFFLEDVEAVPPPDDTRSATIIPTFTGDGSALRPPVVSRENPLLRSGLAFAGFNTRASAGEDGVLTALEAAGLRLRGTRLVVMSACETGVGSVATGEGVYGLRRALVMAGAESQLMSLWKVDDYATAELMQLYYERILSGEDRSESLRQVQLDLLTAPAYAHPYYWSSFLFSGDWRPLDGASDQ